MDKITALKILIEHSTILNDEVKVTLLSKVDTLSDEDVEALGTMLAKEMEMNVEEIEEFRDKINEVTN